LQEYQLIQLLETVLICINIFEEQHATITHTHPDRISDLGEHAIFSCCVTITSQRRKSRHALSGLTDDQLRDIGITRSKAWREAQKPFWKE